MKPKEITNFVIGWHRFIAQANYPIQRNITFYGAIIQEDLLRIIQPCSQEIVAIWKVHPKTT